MFEAQLLNRNSQVYGPWMERQGDLLKATCDLVDLDSGTTLTVKLFTKNKEDTGNGSDVDSTTPTTISLTAAGQGSATWGPDTGTGLKELVRYQFTVSDNASDWALFRMLSPVWFNAVDAS